MTLNPGEVLQQISPEHRLIIDAFGGIVGILNKNANGADCRIASPPVAVGSLPSAVGRSGWRAVVSDANATTFASVVAAGGANTVPVYSDGAAWRIG